MVAAILKNSTAIIKSTAVIFIAMNQPRPYNTRSGYQEEPSANETAAVSQSLARSEQKDDGLAGSFEGTPPSLTQTTPQDPMTMMAQAMAALLASSKDDKTIWREHQMAEERRRREEADIRIATEVRYRQEEEERRRREEEVQIKWVEVERERQIRMEKLEELSAQRGNSAME